MTTNQIEMPVVIEDREILHRAEVKGERIGRVQKIEYRGVVTTVNFWYNEAGVLIRVI